MAIPDKRGGGNGTSLPHDRFHVGEVWGGNEPGNSAVEAVPTPEENIPLLTYFLEMGILNGFGPCCLAARQIAQKKDYQLIFR